MYTLQIDPDSAISVADLWNRMEKYTRMAEKSPVFISYGGKPATVIMSVEEYENLLDYAESYRIIAEFEKEKDNHSKWITEEELLKILSDENLI